MSLKSKLSRLDDRTTAKVTDACAVEAPASPSTVTISQLREQMNALLAKAPAPQVRRHTPSETSLPFHPHEIDGLTIHRRQLRVPHSKTIGRIPVDAAASASPEVLALLALDPVFRNHNLRRALYIDTETTGLGGGTGTLAFLLGMAWFDDEGLMLEQLLLVSPAEEPAMLAYLDARLTTAELLVSFNGKSFDWPLLRNRYVMNRRTMPLELPHLDLLHIARRLHKRRIGSVTLKRLESEVLGLERGPDIDGAEIGPRYSHFLRTGDESALAVVVEHNAIDVLSMLALVGLYGEPLELLHTTDLVSMGESLLRAKAHERANEVVRIARERGVEHDALRLSARIAKALGDKQRALRDFEALAAEVSDAQIRLELSKLYEHVAKDHRKALAQVELGTSESEEAQAKRKARLERKIGHK